MVVRSATITGPPSAALFLPPFCIPPPRDCRCQTQTYVPPADPLGRIVQITGCLAEHPCLQHRRRGKPMCLPLQPYVYWFGIGAQALISGKGERFVSRPGCGIPELWL